jgi:hypothetical protein
MSWRKSSRANRYEATKRSRAPLPLIWAIAGFHSQRKAHHVRLARPHGTQVHDELNGVAIPNRVPSTVFAHYFSSRGSKARGAGASVPAPRSMILSLGRERIAFHGTQNAGTGCGGGFPAIPFQAFRRVPVERKGWNVPAFLGCHRACCSSLSASFLPAAVVTQRPRFWETSFSVLRRSSVL